MNLLLEQRLSVARNLDEFLRYSPRLPAGVTWDEDGRELPAELEQPEDKSLRDKSRFDADAVTILNRGLPLEVLEQAVESEILPEHLRRDLAQATWLRAVMLGEIRTADSLVPIVRKLIPEAAPLLAEYLSTPEALKRYAGIYLWLKFPGFEPVVDLGLGRRTPLGEQDTYRDNWWCSAAYFEDSDKSKQGSFANFTTAAQRQSAEKQFATLLSHGAAPNYLASQVIQWAERTRTDRRVPEALHLVVRSTRYGYGDKETGKWSKAAFDLLHKRYPSSVWASRTPHWFKQ